MAGADRRDAMVAPMKPAWPKNRTTASSLDRRHPSASAEKAVTRKLRELEKTDKPAASPRPHYSYSFPGAEDMRQVSRLERRNRRFRKCIEGFPARRRLPFAVVSKTEASQSVDTQPISATLCATRCAADGQRPDLLRTVNYVPLIMAA